MKWVISRDPSPPRTGRDGNGPRTRLRSVPIDRTPSPRDLAAGGSSPFRRRRPREGRGRRRARPIATLDLLATGRGGRRPRGLRGLFESDAAPAANGGTRGARARARRDGLPEPGAGSFAASHEGRCFDAAGISRRSARVPRGRRLCSEGGKDLERGKKISLRKDKTGEGGVPRGRKRSHRLRSQPHATQNKSHILIALL